MIHKMPKMNDEYCRYMARVTYAHKMFLREGRLGG